MAPAPVQKDVVLVGAGHAHVIALRMLAMDPIPGARITLITRQVHTPYSGMLPGLIAGHYDFDQVHVDTGPLCRSAGARLYEAEAIGLDLARRQVLCRGRPPVPYDVLSMDIGSTPGGAQIPGVSAHAIAVKPIDRFLEQFEAARRRIVAVGGRAEVGVIGGGPASVELVLSLATRLGTEIRTAGGDPARLALTLVTAADGVLPQMPAGMRDRIGRILAGRGISVRANARVTAMNPSGVTIAGGERLAMHAVFWTTEAAAAPWLASTGLACDPAGFIAVDAQLQSRSHPGVLAAGDCAAMYGHDLPKSGVYAVRQGPVLARNLRRLLEGRPLATYRPQRTALYLVSTGERHAVGTRNGISFEGAWVWSWKDRIDRRFMDQFITLPAMAAGHSGDDAMRCGGCGAKVGADVLSRTLSQIAPAQRAEVVTGLGAAEDAALVDSGGPMLAVHTVDHFRAFVDDPYVFGRIAANHALGDIYAMGGEPETALAIAALPHGPAAKVGADLTALLTGANEILKDAGCALVGGHTGEGPELALGFAINGRVARDRVLRKQGLVPGDVLILTKPIGTGTLLAADMRAKAKARWVMDAIASMMRSSRRASEILIAHGAHAATDVTGFGLAGHLLEMMRASKVRASLDLGSIPLLDGAWESAAAGHLSSLHGENVKAASAIEDAGTHSKDPRYLLLFDPQTAGGLLAGVPMDQAAACLAALHAAGETRAAIIGNVESGITSAPVLIRIVRNLEPAPREPALRRLQGHREIG